MYRDANQKQGLEKEVMELRAKLQDTQFQVNELKNENILLEKFKYESDKVGPLESEYERQRQVNVDL